MCMYQYTYITHHTCEFVTASWLILCVLCVIINYNY